MAFNRLLETLNSLFISFLDSNRYTRKIIQRLGEPYLAGHNLLEGLQAIARNYEKRHRYSTFDILGEEAHTPEEALMCVRTYQQAIELLPESFRYEHAGTHPHSRPVSISVKPSSICLVTERNPVLRIEERPSPALPLHRNFIVTATSFHSSRNGREYSDGFGGGPHGSIVFSEQKYSCPEVGYVVIEAED